MKSPVVWPGTLSLTDDDGHPMLVKGRVVKVVDKTTHRDNHDPDTLVERFRDRYVTTVATLSAYHGLEIIQDTERLTEFMKAYGDRIAAHILEAYQPLYDLKSTEEELAILERLGKRRSRCPDRLNQDCSRPRSTPPLLPPGLSDHTARLTPRGKWVQGKRPSAWASSSCWMRVRLS